MEADTTTESVAVAEKKVVEFEEILVADGGLKDLRKLCRRY